jgi:plasmid maintenance system antidote protein VapI
MSESETYTTLAEQLRKAIEDSGLAIRAIAKATGIPQPVLSRFVTGVRPNIRLDTADKLCKYFRMELTEPKRRADHD